MSVPLPCLIRSIGRSGEPVVLLGMPLVDDCLDFLAGRCRPNTVLARRPRIERLLHSGRQGTAGGRPPGYARVHHRTHRRTSAQVLARLDPDGELDEVASSTVARRLSTVSGSSPTCRSAAT